MLEVGFGPWALLELITSSLREPIPFFFGKGSSPLKHWTDPLVNFAAAPVWPRNPPPARSDLNVREKNQLEAGMIQT
jgi:hypothetical protein